MRSIIGKFLILFIMIMIISILAGCNQLSSPAAQQTKVMLWNGKDLTGWQPVIGGKNEDMQEVWSVKDGVLYCTGKPNGYLHTTAVYENYHLHVEWRWPQNAANSGVFVHASESGQAWPKTIECQLQAGSAGDFVLMNGFGLTVGGTVRQNAKQMVMIRKKEQSSEKPTGEWNSYDIYCKADTIRCLVDDVLQNEGTAATQTSGWICLQSEGGPVEFRNIYIEQLN
jgi:hypothetical protein